MISDEPRCPHCHRQRCVVTVANPLLGGFKLHCNGCGTEWLSEDMKRDGDKTTAAVARKRRE